MAESAVGYVLGKLAEAMVKKAQELQAVSEHIKLMQTMLRLIKPYLRDADSKSNRNESVKEWVNQVRDIAHRIEDVIDTFLVEIEENPKSRPWYRKICMWLKTNKINKLSGDLKEITQDLKKIYQLRIDLEITIRGTDDEPIDPVPFRPTKPTDVDDSEIVGLENDKGNIINQLLDTNISRRMVLSIVGTGGLGKTTLALKVFKSAELGRHFDCCIWISISQNYNINDIFRKILYSILDLQEVTDENLQAELEKSLTSKRYLIVLDDVWRDSDWEQLKKGLPDPKNASRVLITSRSVDVALAADCNTQPYKLRYLTDDESIVLLFRKAFKQHIQPEYYPRNLLEVAKKLTKKCGGLPLALVVLGGILSRKEWNYFAWNYFAWNTIEEIMDWHDENEKKCSQVLAMSYEDLPYELKLCFLYFASFPEDYKISGKHVTRMWIAEGFVQKNSARTIEDRAEKCLEELVQRSLIQVTKKSWNGYCKYCNMHDLLWDLAITKAKEENFFTVFSKEGEDVNQLPVIKPRRAALQFCTLTDDGVYSVNTRSLLCFGFGQFSSKDCGFSKLNFNGFTLLRVLTLQSVVMTKFTKRQWSKDLIHLRYLGLRDCRIPKDFFKKFSFHNLETIDLKGSDSHEPDKIVLDVVIPTLKHLYGAWDFYFRLKWDRHTNLQTLNYVHKKTEILELACCINLRTLVIYLSTSSERVLQMWQDLKGVLRKTKQLVYLGILAGFGLLPFGGTTDLSCHGTIQNLNLKGKWVRDICVPSVEMFPTNLTKLTLIWSNLEEDPMPILEKLLSLRILHLGSYSYVGTKLICSTGGFPNLEKLRLIHLPYLCHWDIEEGAMPVLRHLIIDACKRLNALPELQKVPTLQELVVTHPSRELHESMQGDEDLHKIKHIPFVRIGR